MIGKSSPAGAAPYSAALISLSVPSTPQRSTRTNTPRPLGTSFGEGMGRSARWTLSRWPGNTAIAFIHISSRELVGGLAASGRLDGHGAPDRAGALGDRLHGDDVHRRSHQAQVL